MPPWMTSCRATPKRACARGFREAGVRVADHSTTSVMPALVAGIHVFVCFKTWMAGTKPGHDE